MKLAYTVWAVAWVGVYWVNLGPLNFLWLCDVANLVVLAALWMESSLLVSSQAVSVLLVQAAWLVDVVCRLLLGFHPIGGTEYMFDPGKSLAVRCFSLFHVFIPVLLIWALYRLGYDRRGWKLQTVIAWAVLPLSFLLGPPEENLNLLWTPFGIQQTLMSPAVFLLVAMALYPILLYLPTHALLLALARRLGWRSRP